jgi:hypothetical protein
MPTVVGLFETKTHAEKAIQKLQAAGFRKEALGVAMKHAGKLEPVAETADAGDLSDEGAIVGALTGAELGVLLGLALVASPIVLPGLGTLLIAGPVAAALTGAGLGAASGGLLGGLIGLGIPESDAADYAAGIEEGGIIVSVEAGDSHAELARRILDEEGARRTHVT